MHLKVVKWRQALNFLEGLFLFHVLFSPETATIGGTS